MAPEWPMPVSGWADLERRNTQAAAWVFPMRQFFRCDSLIFVVSKGQEGEENDGEGDQPGREARALPKRLRQLVIREYEDDDIHKRNQA